LNGRFGKCLTFINAEIFAHEIFSKHSRRICGRLGKPKGIVAAAHKLAVLVYRMLKFGHQYTDIGQERYEQQYKQRFLKRLARKAHDLGFQLVPSPEKQVP
jgi:hypothetical protein